MPPLPHVLATLRRSASSAPRHAPALTQIQRQAGLATSADGRSGPIKPNGTGTIADASSNDAVGETPGASAGEHPSPSRPSYVDRAAELYSDMAGVNEISRLKSAVSDASSAFDASTASVFRLREDLERRTAEHERLERRHHDMMQRRHEWGADGEGDMDAAAEEFARLTAEEGRARRARDGTRAALREAEEDMRKRQAEYMDAMRRRYHEEQVWQDKWRVLGTYGTWALIGLNSVIFLGGQVLHFKREEHRLSAIATVINDRTEHLMENLNEAVHGRTASVLTKPSRTSQDGDERAGGEIENSTNPQTELGTASPAIPGAEGTTSSDQAGDREDPNREGVATEKIGNDKRQRVFPLMQNAKLGSAVSSLHWPSAAVGALAASVAILAVSIISQR